jgi:hypothetical protein
LGARRGVLGGSGAGKKQLARGKREQCGARERASMREQARAVGPTMVGAVRRTGERPRERATTREQARAREEQAHAGADAGRAGARAIPAREKRAPAAAEHEIRH